MWGQPRFSANQIHHSFRQKRAHPLSQQFVAIGVEVQLVGDKQFRTRLPIRAERQVVGFDVLQERFATDVAVGVTRL
jgi:hypothetical protein